MNKKLLNHLFNYLCNPTAGFIISLILLWGVWLLKNYMWVKSNDSLVGALLIIFAIMACIVFWSGFAFLASISEDRKKSGRVSMIKIFVLIIVIFSNVVVISTYVGGNHSVSTFDEITSKDIEGKNYTFAMKNTVSKKIICNKNIYDSIEANNNFYYSFQYRELPYIKNIGYLEYMNLDDIPN